MIPFIKRHYPLIASVFLLCSVVVVCLVCSVRRNQGHFIYPLDDTYIHMSIAKNFVQYGVWGVTKYGFTSSSSSLLWTLLLSLAYFIFGTNTITPFILSTIFGILTCVLSYVILRKYKLQPFLIFVILIFIIFFTPLPAIIFGGMEHVLHLLITIAIVYLSAKILSSPRCGTRELLFLLILAPMLTMVRYEGLFLLFVVCCLFAAKKKPLYALLLGFIGILPIIIYGLLSVSKGWYFLPNTIILKGRIPNPSSLKGVIALLGGSSYRAISSTPHILFLIILALVVCIVRFNKQKEAGWDNKQLMVAVFAIITFLHMQFASVGSFYRYEAYLVGLGILVIAVSLSEFIPVKFNARIKKGSIPKYIAVVVLVLFILSPFSFVKRGILSLIRIPQAAKNIYEQQYQMGLFLRKFYQNKEIVANDIGAISYLADVKIVDLGGLCSNEIAAEKIRKLYNTEFIHKVTIDKKARIAIIYADWDERFGGIPKQWVKIRQWKIVNNVVCGGDTVSFFAVNPAETENLTKNLNSFSPYLPKDIEQGEN